LYFFSELLPPFPVLLSSPPCSFLIFTGKPPLASGPKRFLLVYCVKRWCYLTVIGRSSTGSLSHRLILYMLIIPCSLFFFPCLLSRPCFLPALGSHRTEMRIICRGICVASGGGGFAYERWFIPFLLPSLLSLRLFFIPPPQDGEVTRGTP